MEQDLVLEVDMAKADKEPEQSAWSDKENTKNEEREEGKKFRGNSRNRSKIS